MEKYKAPELEVIELEVKDVITASAGPDLNLGENELPGF